MYRRCLCALFALALLAAPCAHAETAGEMVRLHVVASGDTPEEQAVKLAVRDACLEAAREIAGDCRDADAAYAAVNANLAALRTAAVAAAYRAGFSGDVRVETGVFPFPDRVYGEVLVPAGEYRALRVTLGEGRGHNWWCVLYPTLCVLDEQAYFAGEDAPIEFYSSIGRFLRGLWEEDAHA